MDIDLARTFLAVVDSGSFVEAANRVNVTQSTVSARIRSLEELIGKSLFERSKAGAALTPSGYQFQRHAQAAPGARIVMVVGGRNAKLIDRAAIVLVDICLRPRVHVRP